MRVSDVFEMPNKIEEFLNFYNKNLQVPVLLWGGGEACEYFIKFMQKYSIPIAGIIDKKKSVNIREPKIKIFAPETAYAEYEGSIVVVSSLAHRDEIIEEIAYKRYNYFVFCFDPTIEIVQKNTYTERQNFLLAHEKELDRIGEWMYDKQSKTIFYNVIKGAFSNNPDCYKDTSCASQYFPEVIKENLSEKETFVDLGAFTGDSIKEFILEVNNKFNKIYAFEPNPANLDVARTSLCDKRIEFYQNGVGKESSTFYLIEEEDFTQCVEVSNENAKKVEVLKLDDVITEEVTFIKMDIEGMELDALKGAEKLIRLYKPKLAISIYHNIDDIVEIPNYIRELNLDYHFYLRHNWNCNGTDVVLFAI